MHRLIQSFLPFTLLLLGASSAVAQAKAGFSATVIQESHGAAAQLKIFVDHGKMRVEPQPGVGEQAILILDFTHGTSYVLMPRQRSYVEITGLQNGPGRQMRFLNPVDLANPCDGLLEATKAETSARLQCKQAGVESVNGRPATKWLATLPDGKQGALWIDSKLGFLARLQGPNHKIELQNIVEGAQSPDLFQVPAGYSRAEIGTTRSPAK